MKERLKSLSLWVSEEQNFLEKVDVSADFLKDWWQLNRGRREVKAILVVGGPIRRQRTRN